mgnify:CR=1 FL=1
MRSPYLKVHFFVFILLAVTFMMGSLIPSPAYSANENRPVSLADLAEKLLPSVVNISSTHKVSKPKDTPNMPNFPPGSPFEDFFEEFMERKGRSGPAIPPSSLGSGFVIDADKGLIVTNNHVVQDADEVRVTFHDDETVEADIIGRDEKTDLAVLKLKTDKKMTEVSFGDSSNMRIGDWVVAIGNPFGLGGTVTAGIISAQQRNINAGPYDNFIQTDASINRGNSGGPMFNMSGEVIGINTAIFSPSGGSVGIGFAIPSNLAKPIIDQIVEFGRTRRGWLGVRIQHVTDEIANALGLEERKGALVASVTPGGPAEKAGIKPGDVILAFNKKPVPEMTDLPRIVAETEIGSKATVTLWRDGERKEVTVKVAELEKAEEEGLLDSRPSLAGNNVELDSVGLILSPLTTKNRKEFNIADNVKGVLVSEVEDLSEAAEKRLMPGDVIVEINQQEVQTPQEAQDIFRKAREAKRKSVLLLVNRDGDRRFFALRLKD